MESGLDAGAAERGLVEGWVLLASGGPRALVSSFPKSSNSSLITLKPKSIFAHLAFPI